ncbi:unnamed protein product [Oikopleura dioica]|uniref:LIM zinc-binding domain-containing protein n=1 Tax=Oikopleura dioica TaxID=34765 RepID=E4XDU2_OIKDI|nr:unnamed protein product [Oikopleura dioica]
MQLDNKCCAACGERLQKEDSVLQCAGEFFHTECFVCAQCFQSFPDNEFYENHGKRYCPHDFEMLYAPQCHACSEFIKGEFVEAMNHHWHKECFNCNKCQKSATESFVPFRDNSLDGKGFQIICGECHQEILKSRGDRDICQACWQPIEAVEENMKLRYKGDPYHSYHFNCSHCQRELTSNAKEHRGKLMCRKCYDETETEICAACHRPIDGRVLKAMGKAWHHHHFVCSTCEKPFSKNSFFAGNDGRPYCEYHFNKLYGATCALCDRVIKTQVVSTFDKKWCEPCYRCYCCNKILKPKEKVVEYDMRPCCKSCYDKFPYELKKRMKKAQDLYNKDLQQQIKNEKKAKKNNPLDIH